MRSSEHQTRSVHIGSVPREVVFHAGSPDANHRMCPLSTRLLLREHCTRAGAPDAETTSGPRPILSVRCSAFTCQTLTTHRTCRLSVRCPRSERRVSVFSEKHSGDFSKLSIGAIENMHFIFSKALNPTNQNPSLLYKLHLLFKMYQHYHVCTNMCKCVSIFINIFFEGVKLTHY